MSEEPKPLKEIAHEAARQIADAIFSVNSKYPDTVVAWPLELTIIRVPEDKTFDFVKAYNDQL